MAAGGIGKHSVASNNMQFTYTHTEIKLEKTILKHSSVLLHLLSTFRLLDMTVICSKKSVSYK